MQLTTLVLLSFLSPYVSCWPYDESLVDYNLNQNKSAQSPIDYWGAWPDHDYHPSPDNWRFPVYTIFLDRISNGDPTNDDINGTRFEHVVNSNQMRHGGDLEGLIDTLDYIRGMGFKVRSSTPDRTPMLIETGHLLRWDVFGEPTVGLRWLLAG
jgi:alpha-1,3-glucan synthase